MNRYLLEQRVKTLAHLSMGLNVDKPTPEMVIDGYAFYQWDFNYSDGWKGDAWLVKKEVNANLGVQAINKFRNDLDKIIQKVGFISQCYMDFYREPFLIYKLENNDDRVFLYRHIQDRDGVGLQFDEQALETYEKIKESKYPETFRFLQECRNTIGYIPKLLLLFSALEAMCGKKEKETTDGKTYVTYDKDKMKKIMDHALYNEVFGENGVRHKLDHGEMVESVFGKDYVEEIYESIVRYFNTNFNAGIDEGVVSPQRRFYGNQEFLNLWLQAEDSFDVSLKNCFDGWSGTSVDGCSDVWDINIQKY